MYIYIYNAELFMLQQRMDDSVNGVAACTWVDDI